MRVSTPPPSLRTPSAAPIVASRRGATRRTCGCGAREATVCFSIFLLLVPQPQQAINDQLILNRVVQGVGQCPVGRVVPVLVVDVVVAHVEVNHPVALVRPDDRIVAAVPDLVLLRPGAEW